MAIFFPFPQTSRVVADGGNVFEDQLHMHGVVCQIHKFADLFSASSGEKVSMATTAGLGFRLIT